MNSLVKTSKALAAVAMMSALFACGDQGGEGAASGGTGATAGSTGSSSAESGTGNPALDSILSGGGTDTAATAEAPAADTGAGETGSPAAEGNNAADPARY